MNWHSSPNRIRNWSGVIRKLTPDQWQREVLRWESAVANATEWRESQARLVASSLGYKNADAVMAAWDFTDARN